MTQISQTELDECWMMIEESRRGTIEKALSRMYDRGKFDGINGSCLKDSVVEETELITKLF